MVLFFPQRVSDPTVSQVAAKWLKTITDLNCLSSKEANTELTLPSLKVWPNGLRMGNHSLKGAPFSHVTSYFPLTVFNQICLGDCSWRIPAFCERRKFGHSQPWWRDDVWYHRWCSRWAFTHILYPGVLFIPIPGQFYDMLYLYSLTGQPNDKHCLLMNGDLVDRGSWSIEVILTALAYKCGSCYFILFFETGPDLIIL